MKRNDKWLILYSYYYMITWSYYCWFHTYICNTEEGDEKSGNNNEESEQFSVLVQEFEFINQPGDHRLHPTHLQQNTHVKAEPASHWICVFVQ